MTKPVQNASTTMICAVAFAFSGDLCFDDGIQTIQVLSQSRDETTKLLPGTILPHSASIVSANGDSNFANNTAETVTRVPSVDLTVSIV